MENNIHNQSIALMGGKTVGKTLISTHLQHITKHPMILNLDEIFSFIVRNSCGGLYLSEFQKSFLLAAMNEKHLRPLLDDDSISMKEYFNYMRKQEEEVERQNEAIKYWDEILNFDSMRDIARMWGLVNKNNSSVNITKNKYYEFLFLQQIIMLELLDRCIEKINVPVIFDLSAPCGAIIDIPLNERIRIQNTLFKGPNCPFKGFIHSNNSIVGFQNYVLSKIGHRIYLQGGKDYSTRPTKEVFSDDNKVFISNPKSYSFFATSTIVVEDLFKSSDDPALGSRFSFDVVSANRREKLKNTDKIYSICQQIYQEFEQHHGTEL